MIKHYDTQAPSGGGGGEEQRVPEEFKNHIHGEWLALSWRDNYRMYEAGAIAAYLHLTQKKEPVLRWVKCADRLPETVETFHIFRDEEGMPFTEYIGWNVKSSSVDASRHYYEWLESIPSSLPDGEVKDKKGWDRIRLIGEPKTRFSELIHKDWEWHSFYNGWLEGRNKMLLEVLKESAVFDSRVEDLEREIKNYRTVLSDIAAERCVSYIAARDVLKKYNLY